MYKRLVVNNISLFRRLRNLPHSTRLSLRNVGVCEVDERVLLAPGDLSEMVGTVPQLFVAVCVRGVTRVSSLASAVTVVEREHRSNTRSDRFKGDWCGSYVCFSCSDDHRATVTTLTLDLLTGFVPTSKPLCCVDVIRKQRRIVCLVPVPNSRTISTRGSEPTQYDAGLDLLERPTDLYLRHKCAILMELRKVRDERGGECLGSRGKHAARVGSRTTLSRWLARSDR